MAWELVDRPKTAKVTRRLAEEFATMTAAHVDRPLSERRLGVYRQILADKGFRPVTWARVHCKETDEIYRVNGQHTSTLFSSVDLSEQQELIVTIEDYECDTLEDVAKLYATFDSQTQNRTATDINRSFAAVIPELCDFDTRAINLLVGAIAFFESPANEGRGRQPAERAELLFDHVEECMWVMKILGNSRTITSSNLWRVPVVAAMLGCYGKNKKEAEIFWTMVRDETGTTPNTPDRKLAKFLSQYRPASGSRTATPTRFRVAFREFYVKSIHAWNAWRRKESTNLNYHHDAKIPSFS